MHSKQQTVQIISSIRPRGLAPRGCIFWNLIFSVPVISLRISLFPLTARIFSLSLSSFSSLSFSLRSLPASYCNFASPLLYIVCNAFLFSLRLLFVALGMHFVEKMSTVLFCEKILPFLSLLVQYSSNHRLLSLSSSPFFPLCCYYCCYYCCSCLILQVENPSADCPKNLFCELSRTAYPTMSLI